MARSRVWVLALPLLLAACNADGTGPPMVPGEFSHKPFLGESGGGVSCWSCHGASEYTDMNAGAAYHHVLNNDAATYALITGPLGGSGDTGRNCLLCHVDHDLFRPDRNPSSPGRAYNLRLSANLQPTASPATFTNTDFVASDPAGGLCLSCHALAQPKSVVQADGTTVALAVDRASFAAAANAHNFTAASTFLSDGSTFQANCLKCHDDGRIRAFQGGGPTFSLHDSLYGSLLAPLDPAFAGVDPPTPADPNLVEENLCFACHGRSTAYVAADGTDLFDTATMSARALNLRAALNDPALTVRHGIETHRGRHRPSAGNTSPVLPDDLDAANRHVECADCHNAHAARPGTHATPGNDAGPPLAGVWGVEPAYGSSATPTSFSVVNQAAKEYQVCFKCHASYVSGFGSFDKAEQFSPNNGSTHGVVAAGTNPSMPAGLLAPWTTTSLMTCTDCHGNSNAGPADPRGPHASAHQGLLVRPYNPPGTRQPSGDLCFLCHHEYTYTRQGTQGGATSYWTNFRNGDKNLHNDQGVHRNAGCGACHLVHGSSRVHLIGLRDAVTNPGGRITAFTHATPGNWSEGNCTTSGGGCH